MSHFHHLRAIAAFLLATTFVLSVTAPQNTPDKPLLPPEAYATPEVSPRFLTLPDPLDRARAELSGLAWYGDWLLLLPQYPDFAGDPALYAITRTDLSNALEDPREPLPVRPIPLHGLELVRDLPGYEGFEAVAVSAETLYFLVELRGTPMRTAAVRGEMSGNLESVTLQAVSAERVMPGHRAPNLAFETVVVEENGTIIALHEAHALASDSSARAFTPQLDFLSRVPAPPLPFRVTDATNMDEHGRFWVVNYFFPGERMLGGSEVQGGVTHAQFAHVERMLEVARTPRGIVRTATPPLYLQLDRVPRNWEGVVRFDDAAQRGFLLVSDQHPETLLAYVTAAPP